METISERKYQQTPIEGEQYKIINTAITPYDKLKGL